MKNLAIAFCSFRPEQYPQELYSYRENEYLNCLTQLKRIMPSSYDLIIANNTEPPENLQLKSIETFQVKGNLGTQNMGVGEIDMLNKVMDGIDVFNYDHISWTTGRKLFTCPYVFERTESLKKESLISNPDFLYLNGRLEESAKNGLYNDMFFSMKTPMMVKYKEYSKSKMEYMISNSVGSEQNLYCFIQENKVSYEWLNFLGIVRNDWRRDGNPLNVSNFQIV